MTSKRCVRKFDNNNAASAVQASDHGKFLLNHFEKAEQCLARRLSLVTKQIAIKITSRACGQGKDIDLKENILHIHLGCLI